MLKRLWEKACGAIIPADKNKPKSERLFGTIYLKIVHSINNKSAINQKIFIVWHKPWKSQNYLVVTLWKC